MKSFSFCRPRKDKRSIDNTEGGLGSPRRRPSNEIDHRTASKALEDAALPFNLQTLSPTSQEFEVPSMPILRNSVASLQSRLNQVNFNGPPSLANLHEFVETQNTRHQLNNEGVPFSEISTLSNQHVNEFGGFCSLDRESSRRLNMDFHNGTAEDETSNSTVLKRNTGAIKRTYSSSQSSVSNSPAFTVNYQRNIHSSSAPIQISVCNSSNNSENSNMTQKLSTVFAVGNSDPETVFKSSKQLSAQDSARNCNPINRRPGFQDDFQICSSSASAFSRSRIHDINETDDNPSLSHNDTNEFEDSSTLQGLAFNNCQSSTSSQSSSNHNASNVDPHSFVSGKNQLKDNGFQVQKFPKYQGKSGTRNALIDTACAVGGGINNSQPCPSTKAQASNRNRIGNKNNHDRAPPNQVAYQGHILEAVCRRNQAKLFEEFRESLLAEMTSLITTNESRPHFLVQLFRDLQDISSDSVRQSVLQLIHQAVSRHQVDLGSIVQDRFNSTFDEPEEDEDHSLRLEKERLPFAGACGSSDLKLGGTQEGETLMQLVLGLELAAALSVNSDETVTPALIENIQRRILQLLPLPSNGTASSYQPSNPTFLPSLLHYEVENILESILHKFLRCRIGDVRSKIISFVTGELPIKLLYKSMVDYYGRTNVESEADLKSSTSLREDVQSPSVNPVGLVPHQCSQSSHGGRDMCLLASASNGDLAEADQSHHTVDNIDGDLGVRDGDGDSEADRDCAAERSISASGSEPTSSVLHGNVYHLNGTPEPNDSEPEVEALQDEGLGACASMEGSGCRISKNELPSVVRGPVEDSGRDEAYGQSMDSHVSQRTKIELNESWCAEQEDVDDSSKQDGDQANEREQEHGLDQVPTRLACDSDRDQENGEKHRSHHFAMPPSDH